MDALGDIHLAKTTQLSANPYHLMSIGLRLLVPYISGSSIVYIIVSVAFLGGIAIEVRSESQLDLLH